MISFDADHAAVHYPPDRYESELETLWRAAVDKLRDRGAGGDAAIRDEAPRSSRTSN